MNTQRSLVSIIEDTAEDDLKAVGGGLVGLNFAIVDAAATIAAWPTLLRNRLEGRGMFNEVSQPYEPTIFSQSMCGVYAFASPVLKGLLATSLAAELADGKIDSWPTYFYIVPMGISLMYEGVRYIKNRSIPTPGVGTI